MNEQNEILTRKCIKCKKELQSDESANGFCEDCFWALVYPIVGIFEENSDERTIIMFSMVTYANEWCPKWIEQQKAKREAKKNG